MSAMLCTSMVLFDEIVISIPLAHVGVDRVRSICACISCLVMLLVWMRCLLSLERFVGRPDWFLQLEVPLQCIAVTVPESLLLLRCA